MFAIVDSLDNLMVIGIGESMAEACKEPAEYAGQTAARYAILNRKRVFVCSEGVIEAIRAEMLRGPLVAGSKFVRGIGSCPMLYLPSEIAIDEFCEGACGECSGPLNSDGWCEDCCGQDSCDSDEYYHV